MTDFSQHRGYTAMFKKDKLTVGLFFAIESYAGAVPRMDVEQQIESARLADAKGVAALFFRDVFLNVPSFGDVGHIHDPWVLMGTIMAHTSRIAMATGSIIATLRHPLEIAKAAASADRLSGQRLVLGLASGDRQAEFPAFNTDIGKRAELFRETLAVARQAWSEDFPTIVTERVTSSGADTIPKPLGRDIPVLVTGNSRQSVDWIAQHGDGWLYYPQEIGEQARTVQTWRSLAPTFKPFAQSLYIDLTEDPNAGPTPIPLGFRAGHRFVTDHFGSLEKIGVNHVGINLKYGRRPAHEVVQDLAENVVPHFPSHLKQTQPRRL
jgi:luciferase-type oxidoreductase